MIGISFGTFLRLHFLDSVLNGWQGSPHRRPAGRARNERECCSVSSHTSLTCNILSYVVIALHPHHPRSFHLPYRYQRRHTRNNRFLSQVSLISSKTQRKLALPTMPYMLGKISFEEVRGSQSYSETSDSETLFLTRLDSCSRISLYCSTWHPDHRSSWNGQNISCEGDCAQIRSR